MLWEVVFMLVILKIPVVYLCAVVWWAIRAEPEPLEGAVTRVAVPFAPDCDWRRRSGPTRPRGGRPADARRAAYAGARRRRAAHA